MNDKMIITVMSVGLTMLAVAPVRAAEVGTAFTYQGFLEMPAGTTVGAPTPVNCDFEFTLWDAAASSSLGIQIGPTLTFAGLDAVEVTDGVFTVVLDFGGNAINGQGRWLAIGVCCPNVPPYREAFLTGSPARMRQMRSCISLYGVLGPVYPLNITANA